VIDVDPRHRPESPQMPDRDHVLWMIDHDLDQWFIQAQSNASDAYIEELRAESRATRPDPEIEPLTQISIQLDIASAALGIALRSLSLVNAPGQTFESLIETIDQLANDVEHARLAIDQARREKATREV
jgi:hypothetical protein